MWKQAETTSDATQTSIPEKPITGKGLALRVLLAYVVFEAVNWRFLGGLGTYHQLDFPRGQAFLFVTLSNLHLFAIPMAIASLIAVALAKIPPKNRKKPLTKYLNGAFIVAIALALVSAYGGWSVARMS